jgi:CHAT domain-containing protein
VATQELKDLIDDFRLYPEDPLTAANLGAAILPPDALPPDGGRIYVIPTGALLRVPIAALIVNGQRVLDRHEISYAPGVTGLAFDRDPTRASGGQPAVVIADSRLVVHSNDAELSAVIAATRAVARLGRQATTTSFREAGNANVLHLIAHSGVNARGGYLSLDDDQEVTAADILQWGVRPRLVVLLTCASAATRRSEMWGSLAAAFLAAGSEHVVATLAGVPTEDASTFAVAFYRHGGVDDPVGAVARAQRDLARVMPVAKWSQYVVTGP